MKKGSTLFLKIVVLLGTTIILVFCIFLIRSLISEDLGGYQPIVIGMLAAAIPFFILVNEVLKLLSYIGQQKPFTHRSIDALNKIKYSAIIISAIYGIGMPYIFAVAESDDAPGVVLLGLIFTFTPMAVAVFAGVFQKLLQNAIELKSENELTV